jgi:hypothetical protein
VKAPRTTVRIEYITDEELRGEVGPQLDALEQRYGLPSERLADAFLIYGELSESADFLLWQLLYGTWCTAGGAAR